MVPNKFLGMLLLMVLFFGVQTMNSIGFEHVLYQMGVPRSAAVGHERLGTFRGPMLTVGVVLVAADGVGRRGARIC